MRSATSSAPARYGLGRTEAERGAALALLHGTPGPLLQLLTQPARPASHVIMRRVGRILVALSKGRKLARACERGGLSVDRFKRAVRSDPDLLAAYREIRADHLRDEMDGLLDLADEADGLSTVDDGQLRLQALKLRIDTRRMLAERLLPEFQPRTHQSHQVTSQHLVVVTGVPQPVARVTKASPVDDLL